MPNREEPITHCDWLFSIRHILGLLRFFSFFFFRLGNMARTGKGTASACSGGLSILIKFATGAASSALLLFAEGHDRIPEQKCYDSGNEYIG
ncbi:MAG TPA: hypothetical protein VJ863_08715 [Sphaerochaeta sp.]|nr:hypothetical protein [Sphaerochaeta sp.]